jgi:hypothetical protein
MSIIGHRNIFSTVERQGNLVTATAVVLSKELEAQAQLIVGVNDYIIVDATWEISKATGNIPLGKGTATEAIGAVANTGIGRALVELGQSCGGEKIKILLFECVKSLMQAETYLYIERGYPDQPSYQAYWMDKERNGCRYYTLPNQNNPGWFNHVGPYRRGCNLFNRSKSYMLSSQNGDCTIQGTFVDSYHEMSGEICFHKGTGTIQQCALSVFRAPGESCREAANHGQQFVGMNLYTLTRKQIVEVAGGMLGCYHLTDLLTDMLPLAQEYHQSGRVSE